MAGISVRWNTAWVWLAVALAIVGLVTAITAKHGASSQPMSTANPGPDGALAAYRWLGAIGYHSENLTALNLSQLPPDSSTVFFLQGQPELGTGASDQLAAWLRRGGIVVAAPGAGVSRLMARFGLRPPSLLPRPSASWRPSWAARRRLGLMRPAMSPYEPRRVSRFWPHGSARCCRRYWWAKASCGC